MFKTRLDYWKSGTQFSVIRYTFVKKDVKLTTRKNSPPNILVELFFYNNRQIIYERHQPVARGLKLPVP